MNKLILILTALIIFTGCCKTITDRTTVTVVDSSAIKNMAVSLHFMTDSIDKLNQHQVELMRNIEALDSLLYLYSNEPDPIVKDSIKTVIINHYIKAQYIPFSGTHYGFGRCYWSMDKTGLYEHLFVHADTLLKDSAQYKEWWHKINEVKTVVVYEKEMPWWGWVIIGALLLAVILLVIKIIFGNSYNRIDNKL